MECFAILAKRFLNDVKHLNLLLICQVQILRRIPDFQFNAGTVKKALSDAVQRMQAAQADPCAFGNRS